MRHVASRFAETCQKIIPYSTQHHMLSWYSSFDRDKAWSLTRLDFVKQGMVHVFVYASERDKHQIDQQSRSEYWTGHIYTTTFWRTISQKKPSDSVHQAKVSKWGELRVAKLSVLCSPWFFCSSWFCHFWYSTKRRSIKGRTGIRQEECLVSHSLLLCHRAYWLMELCSPSLGNL